MQNNTKLNILLSVFVTLIIGMNLLGIKLISIFGISVSVAIFMVPLTFLITDIVEEVYGKKQVTHFIVAGTLALIITFIYTSIFIQLAPHERFSFDNEYKTVFGSSLRMMFASLVAFLLAQTHDVIAFEWWKKRTKGKALWLRNNLSTIASQLIDTFVFMLLAFYQITPRFTLGFITNLALTYFAFKVVLAIIDTPFVYLGVKWLKKGKI